MPGSRRLKSIARIAERRAEQAAGVLREQQRRLVEECTRQTQLVDYQDEYQHRHAVDGERGLRAGVFKNTERFMTQLQAAAKSSDNRVQEARAACERHQRVWANARARARAMEQVSQRLETQENLDRERREQTDLEDRAISVTKFER